MKEYTKEQMELWGAVNMFAGCVAITAIHFLTLLFGFPSLDWKWQGFLLGVLIVVCWLYYRQYQQTKEIEE